MDKNQYSVKMEVVYYPHLFDLPKCINTTFRVKAYSKKQAEVLANILLDDTFPAIVEVNTQAIINESEVIND